MHRSLSIGFRWTPVLLALGLLFAAQAQANTTYTVDETITGPLNGTPGNPTQTDSVVGTVTTDGTIGVLHAGNLVGWDLKLVDVTTPSNSYELTSANSLISVDTGTVLNASATGLFFNFASTGAFGFQASDPGAYSGYRYWCLSEGWYGCLDGNSIAPNNVYAGNAGDDLVVAATGTEGQVGDSPLDPTPPVTAVPEPPLPVLFGLGLAVVAAVRRWRG